MLTFNNVSGTDLYLPESDIANPGTARIGFLYRQNPATPTPFTLSEKTWTEGYYAFFIPDPKRDWVQFAKQLRPTFTDKNAQFGWFFDDGGSLSSSTLISVENQEATETFQFILKGNVTLNVDATPFDSIKISFANDSNEFTFKPASGGLVPAQLISTNASGQNRSFPSTGDSLTLPMVGRQQGTVAGKFQLDLAGLAHFEAGFMYYGPPKKAGGLLTALSYPIFLPNGNGSGDKLNFDAAIDVLMPLNGERTFLQFTDPSLKSYLTTSLGRPFGLQTVTDAGQMEKSSRLVFARRPLNDPKEDTHYYLTPAGQFKLAQQTNVASADHSEILCGVSR